MSYHTVSPCTTAACLGPGLGLKLDLMQLHPHLLVRKHLRQLLRRVLGLPWVVLVVLIIPMLQG